MSDSRTVEAQQQRIEELIDGLDALDDPRAREPAKELLQVVLELHANGLARLTEIVAAAGEAGESMFEAMAQDPLVSAVLLLHGLHPQDVRTRVARAIDRMRAPLGAQQIQIELIDAADEAVRVRVAGNLQGKHASPSELQREIERTIFEAAPEVMRVDVEGLPDASIHELRFFPARPGSPSRTEAGVR